MKVWVFVEGTSDKQALSVLWRDWKQRLGKKGWGVQFIPLENKSKYFRKIGARAAEKLVYDVNDLVVGLPDLYPNQNYENTEYRHSSLQELRDVQDRLVKQSLQTKVSSGDIDRYMARFYASALKHDLEMLLLAVPGQLQTQLDMRNIPRNWRQPPEDQNQNTPPKKIVEELYRVNLKRSYREVTDSLAILRNADLSDVLFDKSGNVQCPAFRSLVNWIGKKTGVPAYKCL